MPGRPLAPVLIAAAVIALMSDSAYAQVVGTFKWQTLPYCNVVTMTVVQQGGMYQLNGSDDVCGAGTAPSTGTGVVAGAGLAFGFTVVLPSGRAAHITSTVNVTTGNGTWTDADGNGGTFLFASGPASSGSPRPEPAAATVIQATQLSPTIYGGTGAAITLSRSDHTHDERYFTKTEVNQLLTAAKDDAWGYVISGGSFHASSGNVTVTRPAVGEYCLVVSKRSSHKAAQVTLSDPGGAKIVSVGTGHGSACNPLNTTTHDAVPVFIRTTAGVATDANFVFYIPAP